MPSIRFKASISSFLSSESAEKSGEPTGVDGFSEVGEVDGEDPPGGLGGTVADGEEETEDLLGAGGMVGLVEGGGGIVLP